MTTAPAPAACDVSVIVPLRDEEENVEPLYAELSAVLRDMGGDHEIVFVDDGSRDRSLERLRRATGGDARVTIVELARGFGQTAALAAGLEHARGRVIVPIDADLQNDTRDIPGLVAKLDEPPGYDIVSGWRKRRRDRWLGRRIPSWLANRLIRAVTDVRLHDFGCTLKAYRREAIEGLGLYGELHRFLPALAAWNGARIAEMVVGHRPRVHGESKYGLGRTAKVLLDLVTVRFLCVHVTKPIHFFGKVGLASVILAVLTLCVAVAQRFGYLGQPQGLHLNDNVLVPLAALLAFLSVQCLLFGIVAELLVRVYHDARGRRTYRVRKVHGRASGAAPPGATA